MKISRYAVLLLGVVFTLSACAVESASMSSGEEPTVESTVQSVTSTSPSDGPTTEPLLDSVSAVRESLANSEGVGIGRVILTVQEEVVWPNGALGCSEPGMSYTQALVNGSRVVFSIDGEDFHFHSGRTGTYTYCGAPDKPTAVNPNA